MQNQDPQTPERRKKKWAGPASLLGAGLLSGAILAGSLTAGAQTPAATDGTGGSVATTEEAPGDRPAREDRMDRPEETLLTGEAAEKTTAAALAEVPGGTVLRVENDSDGSPYEAHVRKEDGSRVTVKLDADFNVTEVEEGHGPGPGRKGMRHDDKPADDAKDVMDAEDASEEATA